MSPLALPPEFAAARSVIVLAPHPDDEILGCGYLLRGFTAGRIPLAVVWLTDGGAAFGPLAPSARATLTTRRATEALAGLKAMEIACDPYFLGYPDGALAQHADAALGQVRAIASARAADTLFVTDGGDGHPDHRAAYAIARQIIGPALFAYPVSARYDGEEAAPARAITIPATDGEAKRKGLACHVSQHEGGAAIYPMTSAAIDRFCACPEFFFAVGSPKK